MKTLSTINNNFRVINQKYQPIVNIGLVLFLLSPLLLLINNQLNQEDFTIQNSSTDIILEGCGVDLNQDSNYEINENIFARDIYVFPEIDNLKCLGVANKIVYSSNENEITANLELGSNYKLFKYINLLGNYILIFMLIINSKKYIPHIIFLYLLFNFGIYKLLVPVEPILEIILPVAPFEIGDQFVKFFVNNLFLIALVLKINRNNYYLFLFIYFLFVSIDYLGVYIFLLFFKNKLNFNFSNKQSNLFLSIPIMFYLIRIISGIFVYLDNIWINLGQTMYRGYTRYPDAQRALFFIKCNGDPNATIDGPYFPEIQCAPHGGGPLDTILRFNGDVNTWSKIIGSLCTFLLIVIYIKCLKNFKDYKLYLPFFFLSPPLIHLTHYGNDDFVILLICLYALWDIRKYTFFKLVLILLMSLFNLHPTSILVGIAIVAVKKSDYKIFINTFLLSLIFIALFIWDLIFNSAHIALMPWGDYGFGLYLDVINIEVNFSIPYIFGFLIIFALMSLVLYSKGFKTLYKEIDFKKIFNNKEQFGIKYGEYAIVGISFWYLVTFLYTNVSYRLPSFYLLFLIMFINSNYKLRGLIVGLIFLEPVIWHSEIFIRNIFLTINNISHYLVFLILLKYFYEYTYSQTVKLFKDFKNKKITYTNS